MSETPSSWPAGLDPAGWSFHPSAGYWTPAGGGVTDAMSATHPGLPGRSLTISGASLVLGAAWGPVDVRAEEAAAIDEYRRRRAHGFPLGPALPSPIAHEASPEPAHRDAFWAERHIAEQAAAILSLRKRIIDMTDRLGEYRDEITRRDDIISGHDGVVASLREELAAANAEIARLRAPGPTAVFQSLASRVGDDPPRQHGDRSTSWWSSYGAQPDQRLGAHPYLPSED